MPSIERVDNRKDLLEFLFGELMVFGGFFECLIEKL